MTSAKENPSPSSRVKSFVDPAQEEMEDTSDACGHLSKKNHHTVITSLYEL